MMVSHRYRCIFAHAPKCAGTSIKRALELEYIVPPYWHCTWDEAEAALGPNAFRNYFKFTVVRNPWDRVISAWRMFLEKPWCRQEVDLTLAEFLGIVVDESIDYRAKYFDEESQKRWQKTKENIRHHTLSCLHPYYGLVNSAGNLAMDHVIKYESLGEGFNIVLARIGAGAIRLPRDNTTTHAHYSSYFDEAAREKVAQIYAQDVRQFDYRFESAPSLRPS